MSEFVLFETRATLPFPIARYGEINRRCIDDVVVLEVVANDGCQQDRQDVEESIGRKLHVQT